MCSGFLHEPLHTRSARVVVVVVVVVVVLVVVLMLATLSVQIAADVCDFDGPKLLQRHYCKIAERMAGEAEGGFYANQFENTANFRAHYSTKMQILLLYCILLLLILLLISSSSYYYYYYFLGSLRGQSTPIRVHCIQSDQC